MKTKLEAIAHLEKAFANNADFKKAWKDYIELSILDAFDEHAPHVGANAAKKVAKNASETILRLFGTDWWQAQGLK